VVYFVTGVVTRGRRSPSTQRVSTYSVSYSSDCDLWQSVSDSAGNTIVSSYFNILLQNEHCKYIHIKVNVVHFHI